MGKHINIWTEDDIKFLKDNFGKMSPLDISLSINKTKRSLVQKAKNLGLESKLKWLKSEANFREGIIKSGIKSVKDISLLYCYEKSDFICQYCNSIYVAVPCNIANGYMKSCGCMKSFDRPCIKNRKGTEYISHTKYSSIKNSALSRNLEFELSIEEIEQILIKQNFRCALSGRDLNYGYIKDKKILTISLDRIDSTKGYTIDNVQWVHKDVNMAKQSMSQNDFINLCKEIAKYNE